MGKDLNGIELGAGLYQRKDGRFEGRYKDRYGKTKSVYGKTLRAVKSERRRLEREEAFADPDNPDTTMTVDDWYQKWIGVYKFGMRDTTKIAYSEAYRFYILQKIGSYDIRQITNLHIVELLNDMVQDGHKKGTIALTRCILVDMFQKAVKNKIIKENPATGIKLPEQDCKEPRVLSNEEQRIFFEYCKGEFYEELFKVAVLTGLRFGEICALRWCDIDLKNRRIYVNRSLYCKRLPGDDKSVFRIGPPKTKQSKRVVYITNECVDLLIRQFKKRSDIITSDSYRKTEGFEDLLFTTRFGTPVRASGIRSTIMHLIERINREEENTVIEPFSFHCFRHTYATRCFEASISPKTVQEQLGHSSSRITMDIYTHVLESHKREEVERLENLLSEIDQVKQAQ